MGGLNCTIQSMAACAEGTAGGHPSRGRATGWHLEVFTVAQESTTEMRRGALLLLQPYEREASKGGFVGTQQPAGWWRFTADL